MSLKIEKRKGLEAIAKYMTEAVKQTPSKKYDRFWDLKDLIHHFETDNGFDYRVRVPIWESMNGYEMRKTYDNILKMLTAIVKANKDAMKKPTPEEVQHAKDVLKRAGYLETMWCLEDIIWRAKDRKKRVSRKQAVVIGEAISHTHDANNGINWDVIDFHTDDFLDTLKAKKKSNKKGGKK